MTRHKKPASQTPTAPPKPERPVISQMELDRAAAPAQPVTSIALATAQRVERDRYTATERQAAKAVHAMDYGLNRNASDALSFVDATGWPGFQTLALLAQLPEYRTMHETLADEVVRTWGKIVSTSKDEDASDKITHLTQALERFGVRALVREATIHDQAFGGAHIFPRIKDGSTPVATDAPLLLSPAFVRKGSLEGFAAVEPLWVTPNDYNATDPTKPNFYKPTTWRMLGNLVHTSRLQTVISRPVSDLLKAAYSFRGVSISQLAMPYIDNWLRTRQSVSDTVKQFSITFLKADLSQMLQPGGAYSLMDRAQLFNLYRDNRNLGLIDMQSEEFGQINTPLSGLDALQAQAQEQMCAVSRQPLVKAFGITPAGLNANSDGEIRVWYDYVAGYQAHNFGPVLNWVLQLIQLSEFGDIDPGLTWEWNPLYELSDLELADVREKNARTDLAYVEAGILAGEHVQERLAQDPNSGYSGIMSERDDADEVDALAAAMLAANQAAKQDAKQAGEETDEPRAQDAQWNESDHPRDTDGQFSSGAKAAPKRKPAAPKLKEGHRAVVTPFAVTKDDWGDYVAPGIRGSLDKRDVTVKNGMVVGMHPDAAGTAIELEGEAQAKSEKTLTKEREAAEKKAAEEESKKNAAKSAVFLMTAGKRLAAMPKDNQDKAQTELTAIMSDPTLTPSERVDRGEEVLRKYA